MSKRHHPRTAPAPDAAVGYAVQGYEASLVRRRGEVAGEVAGRGRMIKWEGGGGEGEGEVWVDRYSLLHLLPSLPSSSRPSTSSHPNSIRTPAPTSPSSDEAGWSSLPSDAEDTFFLSSSSGDEYQRVKKRRRLEKGREERMRGLVVEGAEETKEKGGREGREEDTWGGDDEEPPPAIRTLMQHTLSSLLASPNPQILELRILTHHSADARFAFLRGRWAGVWAGMKREAAVGKSGEEGEIEQGKKGEKVGGLAGLGDYGDSSDEEGDADDESDDPPPVTSPPPPPPPPPDEDEPPLPPASPPAGAGLVQVGDGGVGVREVGEVAEAIAEGKEEKEREKDTEEVEAKRVRREKAKLWAEKRRKAGEVNESRE